MKFIREDGNIYDIQNKDTIKRLKRNGKFMILDNVTVPELRDIAKNKGITGYSSMTRDELMQELGDKNA